MVVLVKDLKHLLLSNFREPTGFLHPFTLCLLERRSSRIEGMSLWWTMSKAQA